MMQFLFHSLTRTRRSSYYHHQKLHRSFNDFAAIKHVRDRGLNHAVEREKHLKPMLNIKNLIRSEPAKSLPLSIITQQKDYLEIPIRPIDFIRRYPSIFEEFLPGGIGIHPHIKLRPQVLDLDAEEELVYQSDSYKQDVADRVLKLLMISRIDKIPLKILDIIKWDLGLPQDYVKSIVPQFPDYFRVIANNNLSSQLDSDLELELVCWSNELANSFMEKKANSRGIGCEKDISIKFPMQFSRGFEMDKKLKKWYDNWQKLPYVSPYENATHLGPSTDESDKWAVGVMHEVLNLFVSKKVEKETLLYLGEWLGLRSRFKRALLHHPGIFYLSNKMGTYTVVLRDAYKRGLLIERSPLVDIRNQYIHLMNILVERKAIVVPDGRKQEEKKSKGQRKKEDDADSVEVNDMGSDFHDDSDDDYEYDNDDDREVDSESETHASRNARTRRGRADNKRNSSVKGHSRKTGREQLTEKHHGETDKVPKRDSSRKETHKGNDSHGSLKKRSTTPLRRKLKLLTEKKSGI